MAADKKVKIKNLTMRVATSQVAASYNYNSAITIEIENYEGKRMAQATQKISEAKWTRLGEVSWFAMQVSPVHARPKAKNSHAARGIDSILFLTLIQIPLPVSEYVT